MIQNFDVKGGQDLGRENLPQLRRAIKAQSLTGLLIPHEDEYQNEYLPACNERLMWATGYTGSAGAAIVLKDKAAIFVDGRYTLQVRAQVDTTLYTPLRVENYGQESWLRENIQPGDIIGYDPRLYSPSALEPLALAITQSGGTLKAVASNPIDDAWQDRPAPPVTPLTLQPIELAGNTLADKCTKVANIIKAKGAQQALITAPASIAWLLNIRGGDVMCTPLALSSAIMHASGRVSLFINPEKMTDSVYAHFGPHVSVYEEKDLKAELGTLSGQTVIVDPKSTAIWFADTLKTAGATVLFAPDPIALPKAAKNTAEIAATTQAHIRDGAALVNFLHWLDTEAQSGVEDEISAAQKLESFRAATGALKDLSFETISGAGANGAIVPVPIGTPSDEMRRHYTLVLKGHIALATIRFPQGTSGHQLDVLARAALWKNGLDYDHGTGHGVGVFLGVHEGPQRIAKTPNNIALIPGMIVSNEPGFYKTGAYGIRIENLQYVTPPAAIKGGNRNMLGFKTLTLAPLHRNLIEMSLLSPEEITYIDSYHARVFNEISPYVEPQIKTWLKTACQPIN